MLQPLISNIYDEMIWEVKKKYSLFGSTNSGSLIALDAIIIKLLIPNKESSLLDYSGYQPSAKQKIDKYVESVFL